MKTASSMVMVLIAAGALAPAAWGQGAVPQRTDPDATSPAGVLYEIPLDTGRRDGAPHRDGSAGSAGAGTTTGAGGDGGSAGAGSAADSGTGSARVNKSDASATSGGTGSGGAAPGSVAAAEAKAAEDLADSSIHSENGFGSSAVVPTAEVDVPKSAHMQGESASQLPQYLLIGLLVAVGVYLGCVSFAPRFRT